MPTAVAAKSALGLSKEGLLSKLAAAPLKTITIISAAAVTVTTSVILIFSTPKHVQTADNQLFIQPAFVENVILDTVADIEHTHVIMEEKTLMDTLQREKNSSNKTSIVELQQDGYTSPTTGYTPQPALAVQTAPLTPQPTPVVKPDLNPQPQSAPTLPSNTKSGEPSPTQELDIPYIEPIKIIIPNIFTPNGDGYNDTFEIVGIEHCIDTRLVIKTLNGQLVYQTTNYQNDWDGKDLPDGYYYYHFSYKINNIPDNITGKVLIKRN